MVNLWVLTRGQCSHAPSEDSEYSIERVPSKASASADLFLREGRKIKTLDVATREDLDLEKKERLFIPQWGRIPPHPKSEPTAKHDVKGHPLPPC